MKDTTEKMMAMDGFLTGRNQHVPKFTDTGTYGFMPNHRAWGHLGYQTKENLYVFVLDYPRGFDDLPDTERWIEAYNALLTDLPTSIEGFQWTQTPEHSDVEVGGTGDSHQVMTGMKYSPTEISTPVYERKGYPIYHFVKGMWDLLGMEVDTKRPGVAALPQNEGKDIVITQDYRGGVVIAFEADDALRKIHKAQIVYNVYPKDGLDSTGKRDLNSSKELVQYNLTWTGTAVRDRGAIKVAEMLLTMMTSNSVLAENRSAILDEIDARVAELKTGLMASLQEESEKQVP